MLTSSRIHTLKILLKPYLEDIIDSVEGDEYDAGVVTGQEATEAGHDARGHQQRHLLRRAPASQVRQRPRRLLPQLRVVLEGRDGRLWR